MARTLSEPETATIDSVTQDGRGVASVKGKKVFISGALKGETVRFRRRKKRRKYDEAELLEVLEPSPIRIEPKCAVFGMCGGCVSQHINGHEQRLIKELELKNSLERIGRVAPSHWLDSLYDESVEGGWHYRRRARLAVKDVPAKGRVLVGFRERYAPYVCDMHRCEVLTKPVDSLINPLSKLVGALSIRSRLPQIEVAVGDETISLTFRVLDHPTEMDLMAFRKFATLYNVQVFLQYSGPASIKILKGIKPAPLKYSLPEFAVQIEFGPLDFVQVNKVVNRLMVSKAIDLLNINESHDILDLFCGIGNFSLPLARRAHNVLGLDIEDHQVRRGRKNAQLNEINNCEFLKADLSSIDGSEHWMKIDWDRILLDPARSGAHQIVGNIETIGAPRIVYISCHPGTLARDAGILVNEKGYELEAAGIIDMFPNTGHVESIAVFQKN
ncbi:MAG: 23S rRNA (uracil(1939)-C(5))-methyltransferase RlmD [Woeseia sp.]|nr:23S rRNA (uracil(1939)-C(5))-methyltransferase RlmD [Woeseia sp.]|tara:strand:- start:739 stop:2067 length:1329 start_codon:yes stop_codon:yes gene_type:complete